MRELHRVTEILKGIPNTAVITDGRFSGASGGLSIGCLCPEAAEGGPIAYVENGDEIFVDLAERILRLEVSEETLNERKKNFTARPINEKSYLSRYAKSVSTARNGAVME